MNPPSQTDGAWNFVCTQQVLTDLDFEAANPARDEVINSRADRCEDSPDQAIDQRKKMIAPNPIPNPKARAPGAADWLIGPSVPATIETNATHIPSSNPISA
jgi:hypothetical protein